MLNKLSHVFNRSKRRLHFDTFIDAMGEMLASWEIPEEPYEDGFKKDAENIRSYFQTVEYDLHNALERFKRDLKTEHGQQIEMDFGIEQNKTTPEKRGKASVHG
ncbi:MAG TPA: hypothetical protein ENJ29_09045, partial [Bacteroidetes bacterium]|nr:hypothetical protein [Bacteroidota bacterium]